MNCPKCNAQGEIVKWKRGGYRRYECMNEHRWTIGAKKRGRKKAAAWSPGAPVYSMSVKAVCELMDGPVTERIL